MFKKRVVRPHKKVFRADSLWAEDMTKTFLDYEGIERQSVGRQGWIKDVLVGRGRHKVSLVAKEYKLKPTKFARIDFRILSKLKQLGFPVLPTIAKARINGKTVVLATDISKLGIRFGKANLHSDMLYNVAKVFGKERANSLREIMMDWSFKAEKLGYFISDSWEIVYNPKTDKLSAYIVDVGLATKKQTKYWNSKISSG